MNERRSFTLNLAIGESVSVDRGRVMVTAKDRSGKSVTLSFSADKDVPINRVTKVTTGAAQARKGLPV